MGLKPIPRKPRTYLPSCFDTVGWSFDPEKPIHGMTYNVFGGTLNLAQLQLQLNWGMFVIGLGFDLVYFLFVVSLIVSMSAVSCLGRLVCETTCYASSEMLNYAH